MYPYWKKPARNMQLQSSGVWRKSYRSLKMEIGEINSFMKWWNRFRVVQSHWRDLWEFEYPGVPQRILHAGRSERLTGNSHVANKDQAKHYQ
jgi:hypothetical protein